MQRPIEILFDYIKSRSFIKSALLLIPVTVMLVWFILPITTIGIINEGNAFGIIFCSGVILAWILFPFIQRKKVLRIMFNVLLILVIAGIVWAAFLTICMLVIMNVNQPNVKALEKRDYTVIVLGCHVQNGVPSTMLAERLATAGNFMSEHEAVMCVTTGGYGIGQPYSEAEVGKNWLARNGIDTSRIFLEDSSVNTRENLIYARDVIVENGLPQNVIIVSDGFHLWRAKMIAENLFDSVYTIPAKTRPFTLAPTYWVREWLALTRDFIYPDFKGF
jgi:uncharacterized SAM-binding protein YcdF (DUF218 family)